MTIIDRYIINNPSKPSGVIADEVGVSESFINIRRESIDATFESASSINVNDRQEIEALLALINERQTGWAVDVAKQRIRQLENIRSK